MQKKSAIFAKINTFSAKIRKFRKSFAKFCDFLPNFATFSKNQLDSFVDLEKPEKMRIWLQNFVSIQPRTSLEKSDVSWPMSFRRDESGRVRARAGDAPGAALAGAAGAGARGAKGFKKMS